MSAAWRPRPAEARADTEASGTPPTAARAPQSLRPAAVDGQAPTQRPGAAGGCAVPDSVVPHFDGATDVSATLAAPDGTIIAAVSRHTEPREGRPTGTGPTTAGDGTAGAAAPTAPGDALTVISITGDLDRDSAALIGMALISAINGSRRVCCDLTRAEFLGAAGVNTLLAAHHHAAANGGHFSVRGARGLIRRVLDLTGATTVLTLDT